jgi:pimeloyl-ACP methyl ester carboxylesterase
VIFVHGLGSGKDSPRNVVISEHLLDAGIATLLFDLSGHGDSADDPRGQSEDAYADDLAAAFSWLRDQPEIDPARIGVAGSSLGACVAIRAARRDLVHPQAMVLRGPPIQPGDLDGLPAPTLILVGSRDPLMPDIRQAARGTVASLVVVEGAGHLFEEAGTLQQALAHTVAWFAEHLGAGAA